MGDAPFRTRTFSFVIPYHRGPVKGLPRMNEKLAEYVEDGAPFPRAACMIDHWLRAAGRPGAALCTFLLSFFLHPVGNLKAGKI